MSIKSTKTLSNGQQVWVCTFTGEVLSGSKTVSTSVHQTQSVYLGKDGVIPGQVYSTTDTAHDVWLRSSDGREREVDIGDIGLSLRPGHIVTVAWGQSKASDTGPYFAARNHTTGEVRCDVTALGPRLQEWKILTGYGKYLLIQVSIGAFLGLVLGSGNNRSQSAALGWAAMGAIAGLLIGAGGGVSIVMNSGAKRLQAEINEFARETLMSAASKS